MLTFFRHPLVRVFLMILLVAFIGAVGVLFLEQQADDSQFGSLAEAMWWAIVTMTTVGYGDYTPVGPSGRLLAVMIMFTGISLISFLTGTITSLAVARKLRAMQGLTPINVKKDHIIILGYHHKLESLLQALDHVVDNGDGKPDLVLVNEGPEDRLQALKNEYGFSRLKYIKGEHTREGVLKQAKIEKARAVIILPMEFQTGEVSDDRSILATLTVKNLNPKIHVVVYVKDAAIIGHLKRANADDVVLADNFGSFILASHILTPGIPQAAEALLDSSSAHHFQRVKIDRSFIGKSFADLARYYRESDGWITIGLFTEEEKAGLGGVLSADTSDLDAFIERKLREAGRNLEEGKRTNVVINPGDDRIILEGEGAIVIP